MNGCEIVANNKTDFVIADSIENGEIPCLIKGRSIFVSEMQFDIDTCCKNNNLFCVRLKKLLNDLNKEESVEGKFNLIQAFLEQQMPICEKSKLGERTGKFFDGAVFSDLVENKIKAK